MQCQKDSSFPPDESSTNASPPEAPPLPPQQRREKSSIALKVREAPPGWAFEGHVETPTWDARTPPAGPYFFYGTLQDPDMLREILGLSGLPVLRAAHVVGYRMRLWGQYPAVVDEPCHVVTGSLFEVPSEEMAAKLAAYETSNYRPAPCLIEVADGDSEEQISGYLFKFCGNPRDLTDGHFDLGRWLQLMGRRTRAEDS